jgi:hypothetical protein
MRHFACYLLLGLAWVASAAARPFIVLVYNVENLFDADAKAQFEDYQPARYSRHHVLTKVRNVSEVISRFENGRGPDIIMLAEIEVDLTPPAARPDYDAILRRYAGMTIEDMLGDKFNPEIADLPAEALLAKAMADRGMTGYHIIAADNVRAPGSTHALAQKCVIFTRFPVLKAISHPTLNARAILEVQVEVDGAKLYLFDNHWKSGAGDPTTEATRVENARTLRRRLDEILKDDPHADIILGGDFNSQYNQKVRYKKMKETGVNDVLGSQGNELAIRGAQRDLYNLWFELPEAQRGSDTYDGEWGTLMQMMITRGLYDYRGVQYVDNSFGVAKIEGLNMSDDGMPRRWSFDGSAGSGFSDHFPVYAKFLTVSDDRADRYISLSNPSQDTGLASVNKVDYSKVDLAKVALEADRLPPGASLRDDAFKGRIVHAAGTVGRGRRLTVEVRHDTYDVWSFNRALRDQLRAAWKAGQTVRFYGELGQYKGRWQFIIRDASWVK